jgi:hypothetical protein
VLPSKTPNTDRQQIKLTQITSFAWVYCTAHKKNILKRKLRLSTTSLRREA